MRISPTAMWANLAGLTVAFNLFAGSGAVAVPLQGSVEHEERLPSVDSALRAGANFDVNLTHEAPSNMWVKIPHWLAGTWLVEEECTVFSQNFLTGQMDSDAHAFRAKSRFTYGTQKDRAGGIWHFIGTPYCSATDFNSFTEYHQVASKQVVENTSSRIMFKTRFTVVRVSRTTRKVTSTYQQESITTYTRASDTELKMTSSTKVFDQNGTATNVVDNEAVVHRAEPF
ncbi:MAG: hypothetical protein ACRD3W_17980, partial [Terriglobales bacterium]